MKKRKHVYDDESFELEPGWYEKYIMEERKKKEEIEEREKERIVLIKCPSCESTMKRHIVKREDNGIIGPGHRSWVVDEYFVCLECGTMFKDLNKIK